MFERDKVNEGRFLQGSFAWTAYLNSACVRAFKYECNPGERNKSEGRPVAGQLDEYTWSGRNRITYSSHYTDICLESLQLQEDEAKLAVEQFCPHMLTLKDTIQT